MRLHFFFLAIAAAIAAVPARADDLAPTGTGPIAAESELAAGTFVSVQDLTGGVGQAADPAGGAIVIQMAQPSAGSAPSNAPISYSYVPVTRGGH